MDSGNVLSILNFLAQGGPQQSQAPTNVLQQVAPPDMGASQQLQAPPPPSAADIAQAATAASPQAPKPRRSLLDTIGRVSDVLAKVGGADALYQPTLDAREDRTLKLGDHGRQVEADNLKLATDKFDLGDKQNLRVGQATRGLKAIMQSNPNADVGQAWSALAQRMQLDPATAQSLGSIFATHPEEIDGVIASTTDSKYDQSKYGGSVVYGKDANGSLVAYQPSLGNDAARNILPKGVSPIDPLKFVDAGGEQVGFGTRSGNQVRILPKTARPDTVLTTGEKADEFHYTQARKAQEAADKKTADHLQKFNVFDTAVSTLSGLDAGLNDLIKDPSLSEATGLVNGKLNLTDGQRTIDAKIENLVNQSIGPAIAVIKQSGGAAPRAVSEIMGEAQALLGAVKNRTAPTAAYIANVQAASRRLHQRIQLAENAALREGYAIRGPNGFEPAPAVNSIPASERPSPATEGNKPNAIVNVGSPEEAAKLPKGTRFRTHDGRILVRK